MTKSSKKAQIKGYATAAAAAAAAALTALE
jgi:hypothetical protein